MVYFKLVKFDYRYFEDSPFIQRINCNWFSLSCLSASVIQTVALYMRLVRLQMGNIIRIFLSYSVSLLSLYYTSYLDALFFLFSFHCCFNDPESFFKFKSCLE